MTPNQQTAFSKTLTRAQARGYHILGFGTRKVDGAPLWVVSSHSNPSRVHWVVKVGAGALTCSCEAGQAGKYCVHRALVTASIIEEAQQEADRVAHETATGRDVFTEPVIARRDDGPRLYRDALPERVREAM